MIRHREAVSQGALRALGCEEGHRSFFVREIRKGSSIMDMSQGNAQGSAAEILNGSDILVRCLQAENVKFI